MCQRKKTMLTQFQASKKAKNGDKVSNIKKTKKQKKKENGTLLTKLYASQMYTTERQGC